MRIRTTKPEFWTSEDIASLPWDTRLVFMGLWSYVDDNGVGRDNEKLIVADLFPLEEDPLDTLAKVSRALQTLESRGQISRYVVEGKRYLFVRSWDKHQKIDRPGKARYPLPDLASSERSADQRTDSRHPREGVASGTGEQGNRGTTTCSTDVEQTSLLVVVPDQRKPIDDEKPGKRRTLDEHFAEWYATFPLKRSPRDARKAWDAARQRATIEELLAGAQRYAADPNLPRDKTKIPYPQKWLNGDRWLDEACAPAETDGQPRRNESGELDDEAVVAVLGRDNWQLPTPPEGVEPGTRAYIDWAKTTSAAHHAERRRQAEQALAQRRSA